MASICFVNSDNYPVLDPAYGSRYIGGESVQQTLLAMEFARRGWRVSMVCEDFGQPDGVTVNHVQVWKTYRSDEGVPIFRFLYPRLFRIWRALTRADADVYFQSCAGAMTGFVARFCSAHGRRMIFRIAHDSDGIPGEQLISFRRDRLIYEYGLTHADFVSAQSDQQRRLLEENYSIESDVIDMAVELPKQNTASERDIDVLWVNNLRDFKRPDILCDIANSMPEVSFVMIGGPVPGHERVYDATLSAASNTPNLDYVGAVSYQEVNDYFSRAKLFVNTSDSEGFPNSFLQAWIRGVPVISFFDPDSVIERFGLGASPGSVGEMKQSIYRLLEADDEHQQISTRAEEFVMKRYSPEAVVDEYERHIREQFDISGMNHAERRQ